jgi:hypothetical protein
MKTRPLTLALLVALLGHGLWLAHAQLRQRRQPVPQALTNRDDSPELLVFSRLQPEPLTPLPIPLPAADNLPPPPPLPDQASPSVSRPTVSQPSARKASPSRVDTTKPAAIRTKASLAAAAQPSAARPAPAQAKLPPPPGPREETPPSPLRRLQEGRRQGPVRLQGESLQSWRNLWQAAETDATPPAALQSRGEEIELRRIPLARARADGLEPAHGEVLRLDDHLLLAWIDGGQLWLLRAPA